MRVYILRMCTWGGWDNIFVTDDIEELEQYVKTNVSKLGEHPKDYDDWEDDGEYEKFEDFIWDMLLDHSLDNLNYEVWE